MAGRPKITPADFPVDWENNVMNMMKEGATKVEVYTYLDIDKETFERLLKEDEAFSTFIKKGLESSHAWWLKKGRTNLENKDFSATLWYMNMKNRFGWKDRTDVTSDDEPIIPANKMIDAIKEIYGNSSV